MVRRSLRTPAATASLAPAGVSVASAMVLLLATRTSVPKSGCGAGGEVVALVAVGVGDCDGVTGVPPWQAASVSAAAMVSASVVTVPRSVSFIRAIVPPASGLGVVGR